jgi:hypothetical protein
VKRLTLAAILVTALFASAVRLSGMTCAVLSAPIGEACKQACCANKSCCAESEQNKSLPSQPLAKTGGINHDLTTVVASTTAIVVAPVQLFERSLHFSAADIIGSAPRPALLCTFLI